MDRENFGDLYAFIVVAREKSFTRAAARLGVTQSALSHTIKVLEARLDIRLLTRTTRSVTPTDAGNRLLETVAPRLEEIQDEVLAIREMRNKPAGLIRITTSDYAANAILLPKLAKILPQYPDVQVETVVQYGLTDIVAERFDAGVRLGDQVAKDMIAVRISPDIHMAVVASPSYFRSRKLPQIPLDLTEHNCINMRFPTHGELYAWEFEKDGRKVNVRVQGQTIVNTSGQMLRATELGLGVGLITKGVAQPLIDDGRLVQVLEDWCPAIPGFHLYYPSRRQSSRTLSLIVEALRHLN